MYSYGRRSQQVLDEVHPTFRPPLLSVIKILDISLLKGMRPQDEQQDAVQSGASTVFWPNSAHNVLYENQPVWGFDAWLYQSDKPGGIDWRSSKELFEAIKRGDMKEAEEVIENIKRIRHTAGVIIGEFHAHGIPLVNGSDWNADNKFNDHNFIDSPHYQHMYWKKLRQEDWGKHIHG